MGAQCKKVNHFSLDHKYSMMKPQDHAVFGQIFWFNNKKDGGKAVKRISCDSNIGYISERIQFAKEGDYNISTLVQIYAYNLIEIDSEQYLFWSELQHQYFPCNTIDKSFILLHFQYFNDQSSLKHHITVREQQLKKYETKFGKDYLKQLQKVKMYDYVQIDRLSSQQRQLTNIFFQQIEIVRMIDHIIGALYFLHHFQMEHLAIRPDNMLLDDQGKYVLIDREIFQKESNYQMALKYIKKKEDAAALRSHQNQQILSYLAPEYIPHLKSRLQTAQLEGEKGDIFCVGLVALQMCLLDRKQKYFEYSPYLKNIKMTEFELNKRLVRAQERYSEQLIALLSKMLAKDTKQRINFAQLIDQLNPILQKNLHALKQLHTTTTKTLHHNSSSLQHQRNLSQQKPQNQTHYNSQQQELKFKLIQIQRQFKKVMNNRFSLFNRNVNENELKQEQSYLFNRLAKITRVEVPFQERSRNNPEFNGSVAQNERRRNQKRFISGKQLQEIVWKEYENIKSKRKLK